MHRLPLTAMPPYQSAMSLDEAVERVRAFLMEADSPPGKAVQLQGLDPLTLAVLHGDMDVLRSLMSLKSFTTAELERALHCAADHGRGDVLTYLVEECGQDVNATDEFGTALHHAVAAGRVGVVETLINLGANPMATNAAHEEPIQFALEAGPLRELLEVGRPLSALSPSLSIYI
jgi:ankyrin repeat protein